MIRGKMAMVILGKSGLRGNGIADERGVINPLLPAFIISVLLLIGSISFGVWAYLGNMSYQNDMDVKVAQEVTAREEEIRAELQKDFDQQEKIPNREYVAPAAYGTVKIAYPKTWAAYVDESAPGAGTPVDAFFHPNFVPKAEGNATQYALRMTIETRQYNQILTQVESAVTTGKATVEPYAAPLVPSVVGSKITGQIESNKTGTMILLPLRDKTIKIWTETDDFVADLNDTILANLTFSP